MSQTSQQVDRFKVESLIYNKSGNQESGTLDILRAMSDSSDKKKQEEGQGLDKQQISEFKLPDGAH
jgi:hypothetical protein